MSESNMFWVRRGDTIGDMSNVGCKWIRQGSEAEPMVVVGGFEWWGLPYAGVPGARRRAAPQFVERNLAMFANR
jgi:hypothetical protein